MTGGVAYIFVCIVVHDGRAGGGICHNVSRLLSAISHVVACSSPCKAGTAVKNTMVSGVFVRGFMKKKVCDHHLNGIGSNWTLLCRRTLFVD